MRRRQFEPGMVTVPEDDGDVLIFGPKTGIDYVSGLSPLSLGAYQFREVYDLRTADGTATIRPGTSAAISTINTSSTFRGMYTCRFGTTEYIFVAYKSGSNVLVKVSVDGGVNWTVITESSGAFGDTRFTDTGQLVQFQLVKDKFVGALSSSWRQDCVIMVNGSDTPRVYSDFYGGGGGSGQKMCAIADIAIPSDTPAIKANLFGSLTGFALNDAANTSYASLDADFAFADSGSGANSRPRLTVSTAVDKDDWAVIDMATGVQLLGGKMLYTGIDTALPNFLENIKIEVGSYSGSFTSAATIWDPANPCEVASAGLDLTNKTLYGFDVERYNTATTYDSIKLTWVANTAPLSNTTVDIFLVRPGVAPAAARKGGTEFAVALSNAGSHTESPAYYPAIEYSRNLDPVYAASDYQNLIQPQSQLDFYYGFTALVKNPSTTDRDKGIEGYNIYVKKPSDDRFWLLEHFECCSWNGSAWVYTSGAAGEYQAVTLLASDINYDSQPPPGRHKAMPIAKAIGSANDRCFVGAVAATKSALYVSGAGHPFRYADTSLHDAFGNFLPDQPGTHSLEGDTVRRIIPMASSSLGISTVIILGERSVYVTGGILTAQILQVSDMGAPGTISPMSAVAHRGTLFYLDRERQVRRWTGAAFEPVSLFKVDDQTRAIPGTRLEYVWGTYFEDRYFLAHSASGTTVNGRALVWHGLQNRWEATDRRSFAGMEGIINFLDVTNGVQKLLFAGVNSSDLKLYRMEGTDTQDVSSDISVQLRTGDIYFDKFDGFTYTEHYAMSDDIASGSMSITESYRPGGVDETTSIGLDVSSGSVWKHSLTKTNNGEGFGIACPVTFAWSGTSGKKVYALASKVSPREAMAGA